MAGDEHFASVIVRPSPEEIEVSEQKIEALRARKLPLMVNWWDASVLALVGVRTLISGTIGNYADQRPMQAAADSALEDDLTRRHDYREVRPGGFNSRKQPAFARSNDARRMNDEAAFEVIGRRTQGGVGAGEPVGA